MLMRVAALLALIGALALPATASARALRVVATTPDLGSIAQAVGGDAIDVSVLVKGPQDPHFVEARPSFVHKLHRADLLVRIGMELELGWLPVLMRQARNPAITPGGAGHLDASMAIAPLEVPGASVDRSMGDVHRFGNPHYLTDPLNGLAVARALRARLTRLRPEQEAAFREGYEAFADRLVSALVGKALVERHGAEALAERVATGKLAVFLAERDEADELGGWLGQTQRLAGMRVVQDHRLWPYFARRFGLELADTLEPKPGIAPTTRHLASVIERARAEPISAILTSPYFDARHARFVGEHTGAPVLALAHQTNALPGTEDYLAMVHHNVRELAAAQ